MKVFSWIYCCCCCIVTVNFLSTLVERRDTATAAEKVNAGIPVYRSVGRGALAKHPEATCHITLPPFLPPARCLRISITACRLVLMGLLGGHVRSITPTSSLRVVAALGRSKSAAQLSHSFPYLLHLFLLTINNVTVILIFYAKKPFYFFCR